MNSVVTNVVLVIHILLAIALTGSILLQRSEGGALGIGGGGGGGVFSGRGVATALVRTTMILAAGFLLTSLFLTTVTNRSKPQTSIVATGEDGSTADESGTGLRVIDIDESDTTPDDTAAPAGEGEDAGEAQPDTVPELDLDEPEGSTEPEPSDPQ